MPLFTPVDQTANRRWLVVLETPFEFRDISNVGVVLAKDRQSARIRACELFHIPRPEADQQLPAAYELDTLAPGFTFYV